jgi:hypothetical protein
MLGNDFPFDIVKAVRIITDYFFKGLTGLIGKDIILGKKPGGRKHQNEHKQ